jgi:hypothetical protein
MRWLFPLLVLALASPPTVASQQAPPSRPGPVTPGPPAPFPAPFPAPQAATASGTARISGRVARADTGTPLPGAQVMLSGAAVRTGSTGDDGGFAFTDLPAGRYFLQASLGGYIRAGAGALDVGSSFEVAEGQALDDVALPLWRGGVIVGRVTDELGEPVTGVEIRVERFEWGPAGRALTTFALGLLAPLRLETNDLGEFRVFALPPGDYVVSGRLRGFGAPLTPGPGGDDVAEGFLPTYYPGTSEIPEAQTVRVDPAQVVATDFALVPGRMGRVSGSVTRASGRSPAGLHVYLRVTTGNSSGRLDGGAVSADGSFGVGNVPPGAYELEVREPGGGSGPDNEVASLPITVGTADVSGVRLTARAGARITGRVEWEGSSDRPSTPFQIRATPAEPGPGVMGLIGAGTTTYLNPQNGTVGDDDTFLLDGITGTVLIRPSVRPPWTLKAVTVEGRDITDVGVDAHSLGGDRVVRIVLTDRITALTGSLPAARDQAEGTYSAVLLPEQPLDGANTARFTRAARLDRNGTFRLQGLPPGRYVAAAIADLEENGQWNPAIQDAVRRGGTRVTLDEGRPSTIELELLP